MDYVYIKPKDKDNIDKPDSEIVFDFNPSSLINFSEASIIINLKITISSTELDSNQIIEFINKQSDKITFNKFFVYSLFKTITYKENNADVFINKNVYDYVRIKNIYNMKQGSLYGFTEKNTSKSVIGDYDFTFNIPIKFLFSQFEELNTYSNFKNTLIIETTNGLKNILNKPLNLKTQSVINSMVVCIPIKYNLECNQIQRLEILKCKELYYKKSVIGEINCSKDFQESTVQLRGEKNKPICVLFMCKNKDNNIVKNELSSIKLIINDKSFPTYDINEKLNLCHYYQMYCRYLDFIYHTPLKSQGNNVFGDFHLSNNYYTFEEFIDHPIYCFILPQLEDDSSYEIYVDLKFYSKIRETIKITYLYNFY